MLWIHIGMPKTGTTALQSYLHSHAGFLQDHGVRYMVSGRDRGTGSARQICHNAVAINMSRDWRAAPAGEVEAFAAEYSAHENQHCILSSEMFFGRDLAPLYARFLKGLDEPVQFIVYLRRFDDFVEADYKQRAKNGMKTGGVESFVTHRLEQIRNDPDYMNLGAVFERIRQQVPGAVILPRLYLREEMAGGDVITDFLSILGVAPETVALPDVAANRSLSRLASEALGLFGGLDDKFDKKARRRLGRALQQSRDPKLFARGDVLTPEECAVVNDTLEARNGAIRTEFFPERARLFPARDTGAQATPARGHPGELEEFQYAMRAALKLATR